MPTTLQNKLGKIRGLGNLSTIACFMLNFVVESTVAVHSDGTFSHRKTTSQTRFGHLCIIFNLLDELFGNIVLAPTTMRLFAETGD